MGSSDRLAMPPGADARELMRRLHHAHDAFVDTGAMDPSVRGVVRDSWVRSLRGGLDPDTDLAPIHADEDELDSIRRAHPLSMVMPLIRRLLVEDAADAGLIVAVSDAAGQLLWVEGNAWLRAQAEAMNFVPGADWSEPSAGTNAPGTAAALDRPVQILGPEHLGRLVTPWSCTAAPIHDPDSGAMLGVLDVTGGPEVATAQSLSLVRATVAAAESELRLARRDAPRAEPTAVASPGWSLPRLEVLTPHGATIRYGSTVTRLSLRHSEIALMLATARDGMTAAELAVALSDDDHPDVTVRAEMSRLRPLLGPIGIESRPYRLQAAVALDVDEVRQDLEWGELRRAVARYTSPVLPTSSAPAVRDLRDQLHMRMRGAVLASEDPDIVLAFADTGDGQHDYEVWRHALRVLPATSPRRRQAEAHCERLEGHDH